MERKHNPKEIKLRIDKVIPFVNEWREGFIIEWSSKIGFGEYTIYKPVETDEWKAESEYMDVNEDKAFITELVRLFIEQLDIVG